MISRSIKIAVVLLLVPASAIGQVAIPDPLPLAEALAIARDHNPAYRAALAELEVAEAGERGTWSAYLPALTLSMSTGLSQSRQYTGIDPLGRPIRVDEPVITTSSRSSQAIGIGSITVFDGGQKLAEARAGRARSRGIRAGVGGALVTLESALARQYYAVILAEREIALAERHIESARWTLEGTERLLRVGTTDPVDLLGAELQLAEQEHALERARGAARTARLALAQEMGIGEEVRGELLDDPPDAFDPAALDLEGLVALARDASPAVSRLAASAEAADQQLAMARGRRWPAVSLGLSAPSRGISQRGAGALFDLTPRDQSYGASIAFSIPLFSGFQTSDAVVQARVARLVAAETVRAERLRTEGRVRQAFIDLENAYRDVRLAERSADLARQRLELARQKYEIGTATFEELRTVTDDAFAREHAVITARHSFAIALIALQEAVGTGIR